MYRLCPIARLCAAFLLSSGLPTPALSARVAHAAPGRTTPAPAVAGAAQVVQAVKTWKLGNGLTVSFLPDHKAPVVSVQVFYRAGARAEGSGQRGAAGIVEQMMFLGSRRAPPGEHARLVRAAGGMLGAVGTEDLTAFKQTVPAAQLGTVLALEADRMRNLEIQPTSLASARRLVAERRRRFDATPLAPAIEQARAGLFEGHPYARLATARPEELERVDLPTAKDFYEAHYTPRNAVLVIVGDARTAEVERLVKQSFGPLPAPQRAPSPASPMPSQAGDSKGPRALTATGDARAVVAGFRLPPAASPDLPALRVLAAYLNEGGRLQERLAADKLARSSGSVIEALAEGGTLLVFAAALTVPEDDKVAAAVRAELGKLREQGPPADFVERIRSRLALEAARALDTAEGMASALGEAAVVLGDWRRFTDLPAGYLAVTAEDVKRVAAKYLQESGSVTVVQRPEIPRLKR